MQHQVMLVVHQSNAEKSIGQMLQDLVGAIPASLVFIGHRLGLYRVVHWLQDERRRGAAIRELNRLNDHHLDDVGINRNDIDWTVDVSFHRM